MYNSRTRKNNIVKKILVILILLGVLFKIYEIIDYQNDKKKQYMPNLVERNIKDATNTLSKYSLNIKISYEYNDKIAKDRIISQSITTDTLLKENDTLKLVVSLGKLDKDKLAHDKINELGKVPIMMYHGIKNILSDEVKYTGGNVDKDGYTRTADAFRKDLEFYYQEGYRMIRISDYIDGKIDVPYGKSPIILTFDDGNANNIKVTGLDKDGNIIIDKNSAVGILEEYKKKYPDYNVTAIFFITDNLFNQPEYNDLILKWLIEHGYEIGNHTKGHNNFTKIDASTSEEVVGYMYQKLDSIIKDKYSKIVALPFGSPYKKEHPNYSHIIDGTYHGITYHTNAVLRVGWEPEVSPFDKNFDPTFLKRCRAYDNNGKEFDIEMVFTAMLNKNRYISDGNIDTITTSKNNEKLIKDNNTKSIVTY